MFFHYSSLPFLCYKKFKHWYFIPIS
jgi:hypothetical protein